MTNLEIDTEESCACFVCGTHRAEYDELGRCEDCVEAHRFGKKAFEKASDLCEARGLFDDESVMGEAVGGSFKTIEDMDEALALAIEELEIGKADMIREIAVFITAESLKSA